MIVPLSIHGDAISNDVVLKYLPIDTDERRYTRVFELAPYEAFFAEFL
jgi:hypothetical protein